MNIIVTIWSIQLSTSLWFTQICFVLNQHSDMVFDAPSCLIVLVDVSTYSTPNFESICALNEMCRGDSYGRCFFGQNQSVIHMPQYGW